MRTKLLRDIRQTQDFGWNLQEVSSHGPTRLLQFSASFASGGMIGMTIAFETPFAIVALALLTGLRTISSAGNLREATLLGFGFGFSACGVAAFWIPDAVQALGSSPLQSWLAWTLVCAWTAAPGWAVIGAILFASRNLRRSVSSLIAGASVFAIETLFSADPIGIPGILLAYPLIRDPGLSQLAVVGGVPLVSALMAGSAYRIARAKGSNDGVRALIAVGAAWFTLSQLGIFVAERARAQATDPHGSVKRLLFIQPNLPREYRWDEKMQPLVLEVVSTYTRQVLEKAKNIPDVVFWPENLLTDPIDRNRSLNDALMEAVRAIGVPVVTGIVLSGRSDQSQTYRNAALWIDPETGIRDRYEKSIAVPVLESTLDAPLPRLLSRVIGVGAQSQRVVEAKSAAPLRGDFEVGILLCYESLFPQAARDRRGSNTLALVNLADDSWIESARPTRQLTTFSVYRAIEQRLPFIRVAHGGLSAAYDEYGREIRSAPLDEFASFTIEVTPTAPAGAVERIAIVSALLVPGIAAWLAWPCAYFWLRKTRTSFRYPQADR